ncbi:alpha/beta hydrolase [Pseudomaricurvus alkylphenolicus]|uniref:alpha/beta fold hydrolase n=1 Tax=Pseudomaricurvus alkylphenolicus TaxID=1306991 RepID=UPI0030B87EBA
MCLDLLGFGFSDKPKLPYTMMLQADIVEALMAKLGVKSAHMICHDYGDTVGQELLARDLEGSLGFQVKTINLLNGGLFPETHRARRIQTMMLSPIGPVLSRAMTRNILAKSLRPTFGKNTQPEDSELDAFWQLMSMKKGQRVQHRLLDYINQRKTHRTRWVEALKKSSSPIRLTVGLDDPVSGAHMANRYRELIPNPDIVELTGIGHYPQMEAPSPVIDSMLAHIKAFEAAHAV